MLKDKIIYFEIAPQKIGETMSREVAALVYSRRVGSMARKAVLAYMAERANDDGCGVWASKQRIADEVECTKQTVLNAIHSLIEDGLLVEDGHRPTGNGYTVVYNLNLEAISALESARTEVKGSTSLTGLKLDPSTTLIPRGQRGLPKPSFNRPTVYKQRARERLSGWHRLPDDWQPPSDLPATVAAKVKDWPADKLVDEAEQFRAWAENAADTNGKGRKLDWSKAWYNWLRRRADEYRPGRGGRAQPPGKTARDRAPLL